MTMKLPLGLTLPLTDGYNLQVDPLEIACEAEALGFTGLWAAERLVRPLRPRDGQEGVPGVPWLAADGLGADPFVMLAAASAKTTSISLGVSEVSASLHGPLLLARQASALDQLSGGRLRIGLTSGWSRDEFSSVGADFGNRAADLGSAIKICRQAWGPDPVAFDYGPVGVLPPSHVRPKPAGTLPLLLSSSAYENLDLVAHSSDGWIPWVERTEDVAKAWQKVQREAALIGRRPGSLKLLPRLRVAMTNRALAAERPAGTGSPDQILEDIQDLLAAGADEICLDLGPLAVDVEQYTKVMRWFADSV